MDGTSSNFSSKLAKLGLTRAEVELYITLLEEGSLDAKGLAQKTNSIVNVIYRTMRALKQKGFVIFLSTFPQKFQAISPAVAISAFIHKQEQTLQELKNQIVHSLSGAKSQGPSTRIDVVIGKKQMYETFVRLAENSRQEILVISIGEDVPDEIKLAHRDAKEKGVEQKLLFHRYGKENEAIIRSWIKMGIEVRHYPDWGFHLMIFDGKNSILVANNPKETEERTGIVIYSEGLSKALRDYFYSVWKKVTPIKL